MVTGRSGIERFKLASTSSPSLPLLLVPPPPAIPPGQCSSNALPSPLLAVPLSGPSPPALSRPPSSAVRSPNKHVLHVPRHIARRPPNGAGTAIYLIEIGQLDGNKANRDTGNNGKYAVKDERKLLSYDGGSTYISTNNPVRDIVQWRQWPTFSHWLSMIEYCF